MTQYSYTRFVPKSVVARRRTIVTNIETDKIRLKGPFAKKKTWKGLFSIYIQFWDMSKESCEIKKAAAAAAVSGDEGTDWNAEQLMHFSRYKASLNLRWEFIKEKEKS